MAEIKKGFWSKDEEQTLRDNYMEMTDKELAKLLNRTPDAIERKRTRMDLFKRAPDSKHDKSIEEEILNSNMGIADALKVFGPKYNMTYNQIRYIFNKNDVSVAISRPWSDKDILKLKKIGPTMTAIEMAEVFNRTPDAVAKQCRKYNVLYKRKMPAREDNWTYEDTLYLIQNRATKTREELALELNRTVGAIDVRIGKLYLSDRGSAWSEAEDLLLIELSEKLNIYELTYFLERSDKAIRHRCDQLGVKPLSITKRSKLEIIVEKIVKEHGVDYICNVNPLLEFNFEADILMGNTIIEVHGDYWHGNPKIFKVLDEKQKLAHWKDAHKKKVFEDAGYSVYVIWEDDIINNIVKVKEDIACIIRDNDVKGSKPNFRGISHIG